MAAMKESQSPGQGRLEWVPINCNSYEEVLTSLPASAVSGGLTEKGEVTYVARAECGYHDIACGAYIPSRNVASVPYGSNEELLKSCDVLVCHDPDILHWVDASGGDIPDHAIAVNTEPYGERIFICRSRPDMLLTGSKTCNNQKIKIDKKFKGPMLGKLHPSHHTMYLGHKGSEFFIRDYQVLCAYLPPPVQREVTSPYMWVPASHGYIPENGLVGGRTPDDEVTYVARVMYNDDYAIGYVVPSEKVGYFVKNSSWSESALSSSYEVLVPQYASHFNWTAAAHHNSGSITVNPQLKSKDTYIGRISAPFEDFAGAETLRSLGPDTKIIGIVKFGGVLLFPFDKFTYNHRKHETLVVGKIPTSLQELCRFAVLDYTSGVPHRINALPLPSKIIDFCQLKSDENHMIHVDCPLLNNSTLISDDSFDGSY